MLENRHQWGVFPIRPGMIIKPHLFIVDGLEIRPTARLLLQTHIEGLSRSSFGNHRCECETWQLYNYRTSQLPPGGRQGPRLGIDPFSPPEVILNSLLSKICSALQECWLLTPLRPPATAGGGLTFPSSIEGGDGRGVAYHQHSKLVFQRYCVNNRNRKALSNLCLLLQRNEGGTNMTLFWTAVLSIT